MTGSQEEESYDVMKPRKFLYKTEWKVNQDAVFWINLKSAQDEGLAFWQTRSNATLLRDSVPANCLEKVVNAETEEIQYFEVSLSPRPPPKICLKDAWQVPREDYHQRGTSTGRLVADEGKTEPKIDVRNQGIPHAAVEQENSTH